MFHNPNFVGTWATSFDDIHATVVSEFASLVAKEENVDNGYRKGVGTTGGPIEQAIGGEQANSSSSIRVLKGYRRSG
jgi:hypothetical protein